MKKRCRLRRTLFLAFCLTIGAGCSGARPISATRSNAISAASAVGGGGAASAAVSLETQSRAHPIGGTRGMVVCDDEVAGTWGAEILARGGNAIDAAVATAFALSVTRPHYASIGGGGFLVYCPAPRGGRAGDCEVIDYRETAPRAASRDMYLRNGKGDTHLSQDGALASGVPGVVAGLLLAHEKHGKLGREALLRYPIELARQGFRFTIHEETVAQEQWETFNPEARRIFGCKACGGCTENRACPPGALVRQPDLARTLTQISKQGAAGFYRGSVAQKIVEGLRAAGGILTMQDLLDYRPQLRAPLKGSFRGYEVVTMPPPSAGGAAILQMLSYMEKSDQAGALALGFGSVPSTHALAHAMGLAFADRAEFFGDPDFVRVPLDRLLDPAYLARRWGDTYQKDHAVFVRNPGIPTQGVHEGQNTTHFSVIDREGNAVAITTTINNDFGSGFVPPGTGVVMNDEMDDFSIEPGRPNLFGLVGAEANAIAPGKRPLSSMSPSIVRDQAGNVRLVVGASGGPRITTAVFQTLFNRLYWGMSLPDAVAAPREHDQWRPEKLTLERFGFAPEVRRGLEVIGYPLQEATALGRVHALERFPDSGRVWGLADPRGEGRAVAEPPR